jgi:acyl-coenzyme A synthetase/AMP-(fatty) acid ligase
LPEVNLCDLFDLSLKARRDVVALQFRDREYTFGEIESRSNRLAQLFIRKGLKKNDRLCV